MNKASGKLKKIQELCLSKNIMISTAESCTGGYLSKLLTDISGSSKFYVGSVIAYSNSVKNDLLKVPNDVLKKYGAVSEEVSLSMAEGIFNSIKSDALSLQQGNGRGWLGQIKKTSSFYYNQVRKDSCILSFLSS